MAKTLYYAMPAVYGGSTLTALGLDSQRYEALAEVTSTGLAQPVFTRQTARDKVP